MTKIFTLTSKSVCISIFGISAENIEDAGIVSASENFRCDIFSSVIADEKHEIFVQCQNTPKIAINGQELKLEKAIGDIYKCDIVFENYGTNKMDVYIDSKFYAYAEFEVVEKIGAWRRNTADMRSYIGSCANSEIGKFLQNRFANLSNSGSEASVELGKYADTLLSQVKPQSFRQKITSRFSRLTSNSKRKYSKVKHLNAYDTSKNRDLIQKVYEVLNILTDLSAFYPHTIDVCKDLSEKISKYDINFTEAEKISIFTGDFFECNPKTLYKFWCYAKICRTLSENLKTVKNDLFTFDKNIFYADIMGEREAIFANTENNTLIEVRYNYADSLPCIFINAKTLGEKTKILSTYAFDIIYAEIFSKADIMRAHAYADMIVEKGSGKRLICKCLTVFLGEKSAENSNLIALSPNFSEDIDRFLKNSFGKRDESEYQNTFACFAKDFDDKEFETKVLVGVVKTKTQFDINFSKKFYYIPQRFIADGVSDLKYVAIYKSKSLFGAESGIKYYGEIENVTLTERENIKEIPKNSPELYYRFNIKQWIELENVIKPKDFAEVCTFTNIFLLKNTVSVPELYIHSFEEFVLYSCIKEFWNREEVCGFEIGTNYLKFDTKFVTLFAKEIVQFRKSAYNSDLIALARDILMFI